MLKTFFLGVFTLEIQVLPALFFLEDSGWLGN